MCNQAPVALRPQCCLMQTPQLLLIEPARRSPRQAFLGENLPYTTWGFCAVRRPHVGSFVSDKRGVARAGVGLKCSCRVLALVLGRRPVAPAVIEPELVAREPQHGLSGFRPQWRSQAVGTFLREVVLCCPI